MMFIMLLQYCLFSLFFSIDFIGSLNNRVLQKTYLKENRLRDWVCSTVQYTTWRQYYIVFQGLKEKKEHN